jgi:cerevisin
MRSILISLLFGLLNASDHGYILIERTPTQTSPAFTSKAHHVQINDLSIYITNDIPKDASNFIIEEDVRLNLPERDAPRHPEYSVPWHLDRISKRHLPLDNTYPYSQGCLKSQTVNTYIIDTGIDVHHSQFQGRATWLANFADNVDTDCNSHGTHCAGLVGSLDYGVCKDANLFAIKVLDCKGSGMLSGVIKGIQYAWEHHKTQENAHAVLSMSLGGGHSVAINMAVEAVLKHSERLHFTVAAGNEDTDACNTSPASAIGVFTVMASNDHDERAYFSNYGKCADIYAPGVSIKSTIPDEGYAVYSGTSMATPILAGVLNHYIDMYPELDYKLLKKKVQSDATKKIISGRSLVYLER